MRCESRLLLNQVLLNYLGSYGVASGAEAFASSIASGVEGVVVSFLRFLVILLLFSAHLRSIDEAN
jgi:hypothetical protein